MSDLDLICQQYETFATVTVECDNCRTQAPIGRMQPVLANPVEFWCVKCLRELPYDQFLALVQRATP